MKLALAICSSVLSAVHSVRAADVEIDNDDSGYVAAELNSESTKWGVSYPGQAITTNRSGAVKKIRFAPAMLNGDPVPSFKRRVFCFSGRQLNSKVVKQFDKYYQLFSQEFSKAESDPELLQKHLGRMSGMRQANPSAQAILNHAEMVYANKYLPLDKRVAASKVADIYRLGRLSKSRK